MFLKLEVGEMEIDETLARIKVQILHIIKWTITKRKKLTKINLDSKENLQQVKINVDLKPIFSYQLIELLKEFKDIVAWTYKDLKGIPHDVARH